LILPDVCRHQDHSNIVRRNLNRLQHLDAGQARYSHAQEKYARLDLIDHLQSLFSVSSLSDNGESGLFFEQAAQTFPEHVVGVRNQYSGIGATGAHDSAAELAFVVAAMSRSIVQSIHYSYNFIKVNSK
jgi:hypothetical protein